MNNGRYPEEVSIPITLEELSRPRQTTKEWIESYGQKMIKNAEILNKEIEKRRNEMNNELLEKVIEIVRKLPKESAPPIFESEGTGRTLSFVYTDTLNELNSLLFGTAEEQDLQRIYDALDDCPRNPHSALGYIESLKHRSKKLDEVKEELKKAKHAIDQLTTGLVSYAQKSMWMQVHPEATLPDNFYDQWIRNENGYHIARHYLDSALIRRKEEWEDNE